MEVIELDIEQRHINQAFYLSKEGRNTCKGWKHCCPVSLATAEKFDYGVRVLTNSLEVEIKPYPTHITDIKPAVRYSTDQRTREFTNSFDHCVLNNNIENLKPFKAILTRIITTNEN